MTTSFLKLLFWIVVVSLVVKTFVVQPTNESMHDACWEDSDCRAIQEVR